MLQRLSPDEQRENTITHPDLYPWRAEFSAAERFRDNLIPTSQFQCQRKGDFRGKWRQLETRNRADLATLHYTQEEHNGNSETSS